LSGSFEAREHFRQAAFKLLLEQSVNLKRFIAVDREAIAGIIAAVAAIVMHLLHLVDEAILITIALLLIALLFMRDLRRDREQAHASIRDIQGAIQSVRAFAMPAGPWSRRFLHVNRRSTSCRRVSVSKL
jgi:hypothetical protein